MGGCLPLAGARADEPARSFRIRLAAWGTLASYGAAGPGRGVLQELRRPNDEERHRPRHHCDRRGGLGRPHHEHDDHSRNSGVHSRDDRRHVDQELTPPLAAHSRPGWPVVPRMPRLRNPADRSLQGRPPAHRDQLIRPAIPASLLALAPRLPGRGRRRPPEARPQLVGYDLHDRAGAAVLGGPAPLQPSAHDHDPAALRQRLGGMLGLVAPHDHGEERRLLLPPT
jgi:hypothetical protein